MEETAITTSRFSMRPSVVARHTMLHRSAISWLIWSLPIIVAVFCGLLYDERILFIAAAIVFVLFPTLRLLSYNDIMTRPWAVNSLYPHEATLTATGDIEISFFPIPHKEEDEEHALPQRVPEPLVIRHKTVLNCYYWDKYLVVDYRIEHKLVCRELLIPLKAFASPEQSFQFFDRLSR
jgi:hypothetical protein